LMFTQQTLLVFRT